MSRRSNGEGTIVQRADGRWYGAISLGWKDGRRERKGVYGRTKRDVAKKMRKYLVDRDSGRPVSTSGQTLGKFLTSWLESIKHSVAVRTWDNYEAICRLHLIPALGKIRLERLTVEDIQALLNSKYEGGLSVTTVRHIKIALSIALNQGIGAGLLGWNAASRAKAPKKSHNQKVKAYSLDEVARIRAAAVQSRLDDILEVEFGLGLRRGEVLALSWNDIDLDSSPTVLHVRHSLQRARGKLQIMDTKTAGSERTITHLPETVLKALRKRRARQAEQKLKAGADWTDTGLVFTTSTGKPLEPRNVTRSFHGLLKRADIDRTSARATMHMLRHTFTSLAFNNGVSILDVSQILGHKDATTTLKTYSHFMPETGRAAKKMDAILAKV